jgi:hypothetical protein
MNPHNSYLRELLIINELSIGDIELCSCGNAPMLPGGEGALRVEGNRK